ncbi:type III secretion system export apparatus subunit SctS [Herbaspirillum huttiense F1]|uniref:Type III secretion system export apparatus subunit SctS n=1 Tax=Herbaspirillum huttiense subsp. lycopersici TaxID=3074428 RepID=A0ABU2ET30_9BURK|nr:MULTISPECIES: type III secretion system export apparatus subunit SctS [Herbaspirillum]BEV15665.1 type III secretion system export apparatus subunit SctS [Herbaspirillum sp. DW155]MBP1313308.1 type III secretion protein S [Herbaspirillum sp. 1130]MDR6738550.1 type III secretion protein S [Herbaspirillum sp. 1173]MDR9851316.1 type III secretion system export apparatus subunit SctS [Herbaspirillum huttiense SE1]MDT0358229.1 type III secretion system export apparatus subunit SctS [Herbaspirillu
MADTLNFFQQGLWMAVMMSAPPLVIATLCGVVVSLIQAVTQIQDQTLPYVVKLVAVAVTLATMGRWIGVELLRLADLAMTMVPDIGR